MHDACMVRYIDLVPSEDRRYPLDQWNVVDLSQLTICRPPQLVVRPRPCPHLARSSVSRRPVPILFLQKEECLNSSRLSEGEERAEESHGLDVSCCRDFAAARLVSVHARISYWGKRTWFLTNLDGTS
jgi:hypothetical protein